MITVILDYEARSGVNLITHGSFRWSDDAQFKILMAAVGLAAPGSKTYLWVHPDYRKPEEEAEAAEAEKLLNSADIIYAHNVTHEIANTWGANKADGECPLASHLPLERWRCTAAVARRAGLPGALGTVLDVLGLPQQKNPIGKKLIQVFCVPNKKTGRFGDPHALPEEWEAFKQYCRDDLDGERALLNDLKAFELRDELLETFLFDLRLNLRGVPVNVPAIKQARQVVTDTEQRVRAEFRELTAVDAETGDDEEEGIAPSRREAVRVWLKDHAGWELPNMQSATVKTALASKTIPPLAHKALTLYQELSYTAVTKLKRMQECACSDGRVRGCHLFYGAGTGRASGKHIQPQNFKKPTKAMRKVTDSAYRLLCSGASSETLDDLCGPPLEVIASSIRHFIHAQGHELLQGDYAAIEARIVCWLAGQTDILDAHRRADAGTGPDVYRIMAASVYGGSPYDMTDDQRSFGKVIELAAGFGMGRTKFKATAQSWGAPCDDEMADLAITTYRRTHDKVVRYWYLLDNNVREAIRHPNVRFGTAIVRRIGRHLYLLLSLPSGRSIAYWQPQLKMLPFSKENPELTETITYVATPISGHGVQTLKTWSGSLVENCVQGIAADVMFHGARQAEARGMEPFMLVHDEALALRHPGRTPEMFADAMGTLPPWAKGLPLKVEAKVMPYYRK